MKTLDQRLGLQIILLEAGIFFKEELFLIFSYLLVNEIVLLQFSEVKKVLRSTSISQSHYFQDCKRGKNERLIAVSEYFPKNLNDFVISLSTQNGDNDENGEEEEFVVFSSNDKEVKGPEFLRSISKKTLEALAYLEYKGVVHTNLVIKMIIFPHLLIFI